MFVEDVSERVSRSPPNPPRIILRCMRYISDNTLDTKDISYDTEMKIFGEPSIAGGHAGTLGTQ
jgi:hypothetical protein